MNRKSKLDILKKRDSIKSLQIIGNGEAFIDILEATVNELKESLGVGVEINNADDLIEQLSKIEGFQKDVKDLRDAIQSIDVPKGIKIEGLEDLVKATKVIADKKDPKPIIQKLDISVLENVVNGVGSLIDKVEELQVPKQGQEPGDYVPMRRVMKVGNKLMYDDSFYTGGGGSTSSSSSTLGNVVITDAGGEAATVTGGKLDVNATASLSGDAVPVAGAATAVSVQVVDGSGNQISSFGGGTQYTEDAAAAANPVGTVLNLIREDARAGGLTTTDGDNVAARGNNKGELYVKATDSDALLTTIDADTSDIATSLGSIDNAVDGNYLNVNVNIAGVDAVSGSGTATGALRVELPTNGTGTVGLNAGTNNIGDVDVLSVVPGTGATNLGKAEDAAHASGDTGVAILGVRNDANTARSDTDGDYTPISTDSEGSVRILGNRAHDDVDSGRPIKIGGKATSATPTAVANNDRVDAYFDLRGRIQATPAIPEQDLATEATSHVKKYYTNAGAVTDGIVWSPAAGKRWFITDIFINVSAAATVTLEDDLGAGDSVVWKAELAANSGWSHSFETPLYSGEDAADLIITTSAGNVYVTVTGYEI